MKRRRSHRPPQDSLFSSETEPTNLDQEVEKARQTALRFLSRRMRTGREIHDKLAQKGYDSEAISIVVERLTSVGLINDAEYAGAFLRTSLKLRPRSYKSLQSELIKKGVPRETVGSAIRQSSELTPEVEVARRVMDKASRVYGKLPSAERRRKLFLFLARRGFSLDTISELLGEEDR